MCALYEISELTSKKIMLKYKYLMYKINAFFIIGLRTLICRLPLDTNRKRKKNGEEFFKVQSFKITECKKNETDSLQRIFNLNLAFKNMICIQLVSHAFTHTESPIQRGKICYLKTDLFSQLKRDVLTTCVLGCS